MKFRASLAVLTLALALSSVATAHANGCSNRTIRGTYSFTVHGQILGGPMAGIVEGIASTTFDGFGNLKQVDRVSQNGVSGTDWRPGSGNYTLNSDCTGTMTINNEGMPFPLELAIIVSQSGKIIHTVVLNAGFAIRSDAERTVAVFGW